jgi:hypothetical protein
MNTITKPETARVASATGATQTNASANTASANTNTQIEGRRAAAMPRGAGVNFQIYAQRALNAEIWDVQGKRYIDFGSGIAVLNTVIRASSRRSSSNSNASPTPRFRWCRMKSSSHLPSD